MPSERDLQEFLQARAEQKPAVRRWNVGLLAAIAGSLAVWFGLFLAGEFLMRACRL